MTPAARSIRWIAAVAASLFLFAACGSDASPSNSAATDTQPAAAAATSTAVPAEPIEVANGREAITAARGEPHILWFWGAH